MHDIHDASKLDTENSEALKTRINKPIVLVGMMGTGKSHAGKLLAHTLHVPFFDSDHIIEERAGITINDIFELYGEEKFRETEAKTIVELLGQGACVIATGGGALTTPATLDEVKQKSISVWLQTDIPTLFKRIEHAKNRPLLKQDNPEAVLKQLLDKRASLYEQADCHVETHPNDINQTVHLIIDALYQHLVDETQ